MSTDTPELRPLLVLTRPEFAELPQRSCDPQALPEILHLPLLQLCLAHCNELLQAQLQRASHADLLIFVSRFAAICAHQMAPQLRDNKKARWYAVGPATAQSVQQLFGVCVTQPPPGAAHSEGLLEQIQTRPGERAALFAAPDGRTLLLDRLLERGVHVELIEVYQRQRLPPDPRALELLRSAAERAVYTASSVQLLHAVVELLAQLERTPAQSPLIVSAPRIRETALQLGFADVRQAASADLLDLVSVLHRTDQH